MGILGCFSILTSSCLSTVGLGAALASSFTFGTGGWATFYSSLCDGAGFGNFGTGAFLATFGSCFEVGLCFDAGLGETFFVFLFGVIPLVSLLGFGGAKLLFFDAP